MAYGIVLPSLTIKLEVSQASIAMAAMSATIHSAPSGKEGCTTLAMQMTHVASGLRATQTRGITALQLGHISSRPDRQKMMI